MFSLSSEKYIGTYAAKRREDPEWQNIIKPTLDI
jgi:hypothetical protein